MLRLQLKDGGLLFGENLHISFLQTMQTAEGDVPGFHTPDYGVFPVFCASDYARSVPATWRTRPSVFIPIHSHEAVRMCFATTGRGRAAVKIGIDGVNVLTGNPWNERISGEPQNYVVCPGQRELDGYLTDDGALRQISAPPSSLDEPVGGLNGECVQLRLMVFAPRPASTPRAEPQGRPYLPADQTIPPWPDLYGTHTWDLLNHGSVWVYLVSVATFCNITGRAAPASPVPFGRYGEPRVRCFAGDSCPTVTAMREKPPKAGYKPLIRRPNRKD